MKLGLERCCGNLGMVCCSIVFLYVLVFDKRAPLYRKIRFFDLAAINKTLLFLTALFYLKTAILIGYMVNNGYNGQDFMYKLVLFNLAGLYG